MSDPIRCFMLEETDRERLRLRRYVDSDSGNPCPLPHGYHDASASIGERPATDDGIGDNWPHDDPRWPTTCECGYAFADDDHWQLFLDHIYVRADTGEEFALREAPVGAMWFADWMGESMRGPDGHSLVVKCPPNHEWCVDARASNGPGWTRTGTPPNVSALPSIGVPGRDGGDYAWHGFLRDGHLVEV